MWNGLFFKIKFIFMLTRGTFSFCWFWRYREDGSRWCNVLICDFICDICDRTWATGVNINCIWTATTSSLWWSSLLLRVIYIFIHIHISFILCCDLQNFKCRTFTYHSFKLLYCWFYFSNRSECMNNWIEKTERKGRWRKDREEEEEEDKHPAGG